MKRILVFMLLNVILLTSCMQKADIPDEPTATETFPVSLSESEKNISEEIFESLPGKMPDDFQIRYSWRIGGENVLDTYNNIIGKDLVENGTVQTEFYAEREELAELFALLLEYDIASITREMTSEVLTTDDAALAISPCTYYEIKFTAGGREYSVTGDATAWGYREADEEAKRFCAFADAMGEFVRNTEEYRSLPEPEGGYC